MRTFVMTTLLMIVMMRIICPKSTHTGTHFVVWLTHLFSIYKKIFFCIYSNEKSSNFTSFATVWRFSSNSAHFCTFNICFALFTHEERFAKLKKHTNCIKLANGESTVVVTMLFCHDSGLYSVQSVNCRLCVFESHNSETGQACKVPPTI